MGTPTLEVEHEGTDDWMSESVEMVMEDGRAEFVLSQFRHKNSRTAMTFTKAWPALEKKRLTAIKLYTPFIYASHMSSPSYVGRFQAFPLFFKRTTIS